MFAKKCRSLNTLKCFFTWILGEILRRLTCPGFADANFYDVSISGDLLAVAAGYRGVHIFNVPR